jgi:DNA-binding Lrp family transcriptional regulator
MDDLTQRIVTELRKDGRATFTDVAKSLGTNRDTVAKRVNPLLSSGALKIFAGIHPKVLGKQVSAHLSITIEGPLTKLLESLASIDSMVFVSETTGRFQVVAELHTESLAKAHEALADVRAAPGVIKVNVHVYERIINSFFLGPEPNLSGINLDSFDIGIMKYLQANGRAPLAEISKAVELSVSGCRNRINKLRSSGILKIGALKQRTDISNDFLFGLGINTKSGSEEVELLLAEFLGLEFLARSIGRFDYIATMSFGSLREFNELISRLRVLENVTYTEQWLHVRIAYEQY